MQRETSKDLYHTIDKTGFAEYKDRGSRFIAYAFPLSSTEEFKKILSGVKKEHPKAVHHCFAYRLGLDGNNFRVSDDGEPSGTAGKPILGQIDSRQLINMTVIVVRYFGGTLLGVPGLINAYKTATSLVLQTLPIVQKQVQLPYRIRFDYTQLNEVMNLLKKSGAIVKKQELSLFSEMEVLIPKVVEDQLLSHFDSMGNVQVARLL